MYAEYYNVDSITKCLKRRCFYSDGVRHRRHNFSVLSMDLNNLKYINDNFGHSAGDDALKTFANICKKSKSSKFVLYRTGGDEFMMLGLGASYEETVEVVNRIKQELEGTPYTSSYGIAMYRARDDFDEIVEQADRAMYSDKKQFKLTQPSKIVDCQRQLEQMYKA